ncbi:polyribonucleotide nucleotidyltransferase [Lujinxingia litoralis]|uniref:Polyribonucleotide nucleotidyltransferase n=1 Tax=Lujinxingia litoralis TaxID=2211119 RepID=A0A328C8K5_9DELT|nr:polyribonucleotide nucleotidyltransferase [Lujinxingia litoralis]RAL23492.1 polyribonucleotide nucleotidyltransferase [Lujinxingia litoralis]
MAIIREGAKFGDRELIIETGRMARQANGSVVVQYGDSMVLCTATAGGERPDLSFFPLMCDYVENMWAAGTIPGGYFKREGKPSDKAVLSSRLIDRPCRPLFPDGYMNNTQLIAWVISADRVHDTDILGITGASTALMISDIPWNGPVAGVRVGLVDGKFIAHPSFEERERSSLDLVMAISPTAVVMVEGLADEVPEDVMVEALEFGRESVQDVLDLQIKLARAIGKEKMVVKQVQRDEAIDKAVKKAAGTKLKKALAVADKLERYKALDALKDEIVAKLEGDFPENLGDVKDAFGDLKKDVVRKATVKDKIRIDGRGPKDIRQITCEVGVLPMAHGSALFTRGETQALVTTTLGTERDAQRIDTLEGDVTKSFMLHYNFPPFCVGEAKPLRGTSRRETGHGTLAERSVSASLPNQESEFPYTIRIVSDVLESNGSSSMASVCGGSLALMDAGVPVKHATAGIAMGLIKEGDDLVILSDILGDEDHLGDMDFKVCGTEKGITGFQLDTKIEGLSSQTMVDALMQAKEGRLHILNIMNEALSAPRKDLAATAPRIVTIQIPTSEIGTIIGPGGKTIRAIQETTGTTVNVSDDGTVRIASSGQAAAQQAIEIIEGLTEKPEVGKIYLGTVKTVVDFGAFIEVLPGVDGLCHISELTEGRVDKVEDVLREGDECLVKVIAVDSRSGKIKLSRREALAERGEDAGE